MHGYGLISAGKDDFHGCHVPKYNDTHCIPVDRLCHFMSSYLGESLCSK